MSHRVTLIPGDGVGPEAVAQRRPQRPAGRSAAQGDEPQDVVGQGEQGGAAESLGEAAQGQVVEAAVGLGVGVDGLGGGGALPADPNETDATVVAQMDMALAWASTMNELSSSKLQGHLDITRVAVAGHSCGG